MKVPKIEDIPTPSTILSGAHKAYDNLSTTITNMTVPLDREEELWPQFEVTAQSVTDAFKKYAEFKVPSNSWDSRFDTAVKGSRRT